MDDTTEGNESLEKNEKEQGNKGEGRRRVGQ